jgi:hypothetical protein
VGSHGREASADYWSTALEIAGKLWLHGECVVEIDPRPTQRLVDLQWAAHQAGRIIGVRTKLEIGPFGRTDPTVTVTITYEDPDGHSLIRAQDRLDALLRSVRQQQARPVRRVGPQRRPPP